MINGRDLILSLNGTAVAASKGCSLKVSQNYIQSCSPTDGRTKRKIPTDYDWSVSTDCLVADTAYADSILDLLTAGTEVTLRWYDTQLHQHRKGQAIIASIDENAPINSLSTLSISFEGSGPLSKFSEDTVSLRTSTIYENKRIRSLQVLHITGYGIETNSGTNVYTYTIIADEPCKMKLTRSSGLAFILAADAATIQTVIENNALFTPVIKIKASASPSYTVLPAGTYTFIGNAISGTTWNIIGHWHIPS